MEFRPRFGESPLYLVWALALTSLAVAIILVFQFPSGYLIWQVALAGILVAFAVIDIFLFLRIRSLIVEGDVLAYGKLRMAVSEIENISIQPHGFGDGSLRGDAIDKGWFFSSFTIGWRYELTLKDARGEELIFDLRWLDEASLRSLGALLARNPRIASSPEVAALLSGKNFAPQSPLEKSAAYKAHEYISYIAPLGALGFSLYFILWELISR